MNPLVSGLWEFLVFGIKEARASIFAGSFFVLLFLSNHIPLFGFARYAYWRIIVNEVAKDFTDVPLTRNTESTTAASGEAAVFMCVF